MGIKRVIARKVLTRKTFSPIRFLPLGFLAIILIGCGLLLLPVATRAPGSAPFSTALFTATSATCVTGLILHDTASYWSLFGQIVILLLIQIGGLGFMSTATIFSFLLRRKISLQERLVMVQSLNLNDINGVVRMVRHILTGTLIMEGVGALLLSLRFIPDYGFWGGLYRGVFHSVSAFCNAGFDVLGTHGKQSSLMPYAGDFVVNFTIMTLIIVGGIGFYVWEDIINMAKRKRLHTHTKMVLLTTAVLIVSGGLFFMISEWNNPGTLGVLPPVQRPLAGLFQSVTTRTAGFASIDQMAMTQRSKGMSILLMFIGGSPGSTAGGIKTSTLAVLILAAGTVIRGKSQTTFMGRGIGRHQVISALTVSMMSLCAVLAVLGLLSFIQPSLTLGSLLFEVVSAIGTVGLSLGITPALLVPSRILIALLMYFGRVGLLTLGIALLIGKKAKARVTYPDGQVMIG